MRRFDTDWPTAMLLPPCYARVAGFVTLSLFLPLFTLRHCSLPTPSVYPFLHHTILSEHYHYVLSPHHSCVSSFTPTIPFLANTNTIYRSPTTIFAYRRFSPTMSPTLALLQETCTRAYTLSSTIDVNVRATIGSSLIVPGCNCKPNSSCTTTWSASCWLLSLSFFLVFPRMIPFSLINANQAITCTPPTQFDPSF